MNTPSAGFIVNPQLTLFQKRFFEQVNALLENTEGVSAAKLVDKLPEALAAVKEAYEDAVLDAPHVRKYFKYTQGYGTKRNAGGVIEGRILTRSKMEQKLSADEKREKFHNNILRWEPLVKGEYEAAHAVFKAFETQLNGEFFHNLAEGKEPFSTISGEEGRFKQVPSPGSHRDILLRVVFKALDMMECELAPDVKVQMKSDWERAFLSGPPLDTAIKRHEEEQKRAKIAADIRTQKALEKEQRRAQQQTSATSASALALATDAAAKPVTTADCMSKTANDILKEYRAGKGTPENNLIAQQIDALTNAVDITSASDREMLRLLTEERVIERVRRGLKGEQKVLPHAGGKKPSKPLLALFLEKAPESYGKLRAAYPSLLAVVALNDHDKFNDVMVLARELLRLEDRKHDTAEVHKDLRKLSNAVLDKVISSPATGSYLA